MGQNGQIYLFLISLQLWNSIGVQSSKQTFPIILKFLKYLLNGKTFKIIGKVCLLDCTPTKFQNGKDIRNRYIGESSLKLFQSRNKTCACKALKRQRFLETVQKMVIFRNGFKKKHVQRCAHFGKKYCYLRQVLRHIALQQN